MKRTFILLMLMLFFTTILGCLKNETITTDEYENSKLHAPARTTEEIFITEGFKEFNNGNFEEAMTYFEKALDITDNSSYSDAANIGLGWCKININKDDSGIENFLALNDISTSSAIVGLSYSLWKRRIGNDIKFCIEYLESLGINKDIKYIPAYNNMFSDAEVHAILSIAYYWYGNNLFGDLEIKKANLLNKDKPFNLVDEINKEILENGF